MILGFKESLKLIDLLKSTERYKPIDDNRLLSYLLQIDDNRFLFRLLPIDDFLAMTDYCSNSALFLLFDK